MSSPRRTFELIGISDLERKHMEAIIEYGSYDEASRQTGFGVSALKGTTYRLRQRKIKAKEFIQDYEKLRKKLGPTRRYLNV